MKMTYSEYVEKLTDYIDDQHAGSDGEIVLGGDFSLALRKILTDVLPLIRDIEASAATVPTVEVDTGEEDDIPDFAPIVGSDRADPQGDFTGVMTMYGRAFFTQEWDALTDKPRTTAVDPYEEEK